MIELDGTENKGKLGPTPSLLRRWLPPRLLLS